MAIDWPDVRVPHEQAVREITTEKRHRGEMVRAVPYTYRVCSVTQRVGRGRDELS